MTAMEGMLYKWTNYLAGWQTRWFILEKGVLSYYKSQDEVHQGSKGSIKMACCEILVHQTDACRLDLVIPGEACYYVKCTTPAERQQWLVALGTAKACLADARNKDKDESDQALRGKMSELRLYSDLLLQQVSTVKEATATPNDPDVEKLNEATSLLSATCNTFMVTLKDCMAIAEASYTPQINSSFISSDSVLPPSPSYTTDKEKKKLHLKTGASDRNSSKSGPRTTYRHLEEMASRSRSALSPARPPTSPPTSPPTTPKEAPPLNSSLVPASPDSDFSNRPTLLEMARAKGNVDNERFPTFFTSMTASFVDIHLEPNDNIPTAEFLEACRQMLPVFDSLGSTAFVPVKMDINGNIRKLSHKYSTDPKAFSTLQNIVNSEINNGTASSRNSASEALLWLKRALEYTMEFLQDIVEGERDLTTAATKSYAKTLRPFHGWVARGLFALVVKTVPFYNDFMTALCLVEAVNIEDPNIEKILKHDMEAYTAAMRVVLKILHEFYTRHDLDSPEQV